MYLPVVLNVVDSDEVEDGVEYGVGEGVDGVFSVVDEM